MRPAVAVFADGAVVPFQNLDRDWANGQIDRGSVSYVVWMSRYVTRRDARDWLDQGRPLGEHPAAVELDTIIGTSPCGLAGHPRTGPGLEGVPAGAGAPERPPEAGVVAGDRADYKSGADCADRVQQARPPAGVAPRGPRAAAAPVQQVIPAPRLEVCPVCGGPMMQRDNGRPRRTCSRACRMRSYRAARRGRAL